ncbi:hypothetical protein EDB81DRAFT_427117 [Dactylonectria macrodidyma]|uniref:Uncharacterized protein n=1 Tax=Dactylonectria macrodidyma TaxID=307937 RepID=A0A9P9CYE4_9HYPO|nr:hypothetical protein EDB81DRAFT_427117 [Dactylonectria macrodidyma]
MFGLWQQRASPSCVIASLSRIRCAATLRADEMTKSWSGGMEPRDVMRPRQPKTGICSNKIPFGWDLAIMSCHFNSCHAIYENWIPRGISAGRGGAQNCSGYISEIPIRDPLSQHRTKTDQRILLSDKERRPRDCADLSHLSLSRSRKCVASMERHSRFEQDPTKSQSAV